MQDGQSRPQNAKPVNLALQGGGSHGAFTWGVLDRFLEDPRIHIEAISGTSAGAVNAVVLADGLMRGGPSAARERLMMFWDKVAERAAFTPFHSNLLEALFGNWGLAFSPAQLWFEALARSLSPYEFNPLNINPLKDIIEEMVDFERVRACPDFTLFISATNVETGRVRVFNGHLEGASRLHWTASDRGPEAERELFVFGKASAAIRRDCTETLAQPYPDFHSGFSIWCIRS